MDRGVARNSAPPPNSTYDCTCTPAPVMCWAPLPNSTYDFTYTMPPESTRVSMPLLQSCGAIYTAYRQGQGSFTVQFNIKTNTPSGN